MSDFGLIRPFAIDNGELEGMTPQQIFVLGYELAQLDHLIDKCKYGFTKMFHAANIERLELKLKSCDRGWEIRWMDSDQSEEWVMLSVTTKR